MEKNLIGTCLTFVILIPVFQYKYAKQDNPDYTKTGNASLKFQLINQRADFSFALFSGGLSNVQAKFFRLFLCFIVSIS